MTNKEVREVKRWLESQGISVRVERGKSDKSNNHRDNSCKYHSVLHNRNRYFVNSIDSRMEARKEG